MARQAEASLIAEFGLPLGLIIIDTVDFSTVSPHFSRTAALRRSRISSAPSAARKPGNFRVLVYGK
jgi:hypothetical protein